MNPSLALRRVTVLARMSERPLAHGTEQRPIMRTTRAQQPVKDSSAELHSRFISPQASDGRAALTPAQL